MLKFRQGMSWTADKTNKLLRRLGFLIAGQYASVAVAALGVGFTYKKLVPVPTLYHKAEVNNPRCPDEFRYPKLEFRFGNVGAGPLYIYDMKIVNEHGEQVQPHNIDVDEKSAEMTSWCSFFLPMDPPKAWERYARVPIIVIRPKKGGERNDEWYTSAISSIRKQKLSLSIEYSWLGNGWLKSEKRIPLVQ